jgi:hypothetical protein
LFNIADISDNEIRDIAYQCGFMKRQAKKIDSALFLFTMCLAAIQGSPSYNDLAGRFHIQYQKSASKQAFWKRVNESCEVFFQKILERLIIKKLQNHDIEAIRKLSNYKRVLIQDSTIIKLPLRLYPYYSGVSNKTKAVCNARVQGVYDILSGRFISFSIDPYSKNDHQASCELEIFPGDLILRDRGYSKNEEIERQISAGASFICRHRFNSVYLDPKLKKVIDLKAMLTKYGSIDMEVCLNNDKLTKVRLVATPVSPAKAEQRRIKAKKEMKGHNPSKEYLYLLSWTIFITNMPASEANFKKLISIYSLRWKIEIIFKIMKSHLNFSKIHNVSLCQLKVLLTARFIMIILCFHFIYNPYALAVKKIYKRTLSLMKVISLLAKSPELVTQLLKSTVIHNLNNEQMKMILVKYCSYDKRKRMNINDLMLKAFLS